MIASRDGVLSAAQDFELNCDVRVLTAFGQWSFCAVSCFFSPAGGPAKVFRVMTNLFVSVRMTVHPVLRVGC